MATAVEGTTFGGTVDTVLSSPRIEPPLRPIRRQWPKHRRKPRHPGQRRPAQQDGEQIQRDRSEDHPVVENKTEAARHSLHSKN